MAPDRELWDRAEQAMREVLAYELVLSGPGSSDLSDRETKDLEARRKDKDKSLRTSLVTAYRWVFYPDGDGDLSSILLPSATTGETIAGRAVERLESPDYGQPKVLRKVSAAYFDAKIAPRIWKDDEELSVADMSPRFAEWTYMPTLPNQEQVLKDCIREGIKEGVWAIAYGDRESSTFRRLIDDADQLDEIPDLFDGAPYLVRGAYLSLLKEELGTAESAPATISDEAPSSASAEELADYGAQQDRPIRDPAPAKRYTKVRLTLPDLPVTKSTNLQPYLWKVLQDIDAGTKLTITANIDCPAGIPEDVLTDRIVEAFDQLGIEVEWEGT